jgi:hypothetical protein
LSKPSKDRKPEASKRNPESNSGAARRLRSRKRIPRPTRPEAKNRGTKKEKVLALLRRPQGATLDEITKATGWQVHTVRGFLSAVVTKKMGIRLKSSKPENGERTYRIPS